MKRAILVWVTILVVVPVMRGAEAQRLSGTYSIAAFDPATGDLGVAVESHYFAVGTAVPFAKAGVGAIATQCYQNSTYGPRGLELLEKGLSPEQVVNELIKDDKGRDYRQVGVVDAHGRSFAYTGKNCPEWKGVRVGPNYVVQGDIVAGESVVANMEKAFLSAAGSPLAERLLAALDAGQAAGGDKRGKESAALLVARKPAWFTETDHYVDLRVDDSPEPLKELRRLYELWARRNLLYPQLAEVAKLLQAGKIKEARAERERVLGPLERDIRNNPGDAEALAQLSRGLSDATFDRQDIDRAVELAERAVKLAPNNIDIVTPALFVMVHFKRRPDFVIEIAERALRRYPDFDNLREDEAEVYFQKGNAAKAIEIESGLVQKNLGQPHYVEMLKRFKAAKKK